LDVLKSSHIRAKPDAKFANVLTLWNIGLINDTAAFQAPSCFDYIENVVRSTGIVQLVTVSKLLLELDSHIWKWSYGVSGRSGSTVQKTRLADQSRIKTGLNKVTDPSARVPVDKNSKSREIRDNRSLPYETIGNVDVCRYGELRQTL